MKQNKKILWDYFMSGGGESLYYPSTDRAFYAGVGPSTQIGYISFGGFDNDPDDPNILYKVDRLGSDHNQTAATSSCVLMRSLDKGATWSAVITIKSTYTTYNITNPSVQVIKSGANKGRVIVNWSKQKAATAAQILSGASDVMASYSDDIKSVIDPATATWSAEYKMFPNYGELDTTSASSVNLTALTNGGTATFTIATGLTNLWVGRRCGVTSRANRANRVTGLLQSYDSGTGVLVLNAILKGGSGTFTDWDVSFTNYADAVGAAITLPDHSLVKVFHWTQGLGFEGYVSRSTDGGITWVHTGIVWTTTSDGNVDSHEASLAYNPTNGRVYCARRNTTLGIMIVSYSEDFCATWSTRVHTDVPNAGKCPFVITNDGRFVGIGRYGNLGNARATLWQSKDGVTFTWEFIDGRVNFQYMYGGVVKISESEVFAAWSYEVPNTPLFGSSGPCILVQKEIIKSSTPITPPPVYNDEVQCYLDYGAANLETLSAEASRDYFSDYFNGLIADGMLSEHDFISLFMQNDTGVEAFSCRNMRRGWEIWSRVNSPTYSINGFAGNGSTSYLSLKAPNTYEKFVLNNASMSCFVGGANVDEIGGAFGSGDGTYSTYSNATWLRPRTSTNYANYGVNQNMVGAISAYAGSVSNSDSRGFWKISRTGANTTKLHNEGNLIHTNSVTASSGRSSRVMLVGAINFSSGSGGANHFGTKVIGYIDAGSAMDGYEAAKAVRFNTLKTALGL